MLRPRFDFVLRSEDLRLSDSVEHARQALAIDEARKLFHPTLWDRELKNYQSMKQVWFCGMHSDVGGGYPEQELSDIPLTWMIQEATQQGLRIYHRHQIALNPDSNGKMHDSSSRYLGKEVRFWDVATQGKPSIHASVIQRREAKKSTSEPYNPWILRTEHEVEPWPEHTS